MKARRERRKPTNQHLKKLRDGRERIQRDQRRRWKLAMDEYAAWLRLERNAYSALVRGREIYGEGSDEVCAARAEWQAALSMMPEMTSLPGDAMWRELCGEHAA